MNSILRGFSKIEFVSIDLLCGTGYVKTSSVEWQIILNFFHMHLFFPIFKKLIFSFFMYFSHFKKMNMWSCVREN